MEIIKFDRILSVNSEAQNHEAKHLLQPNVSVEKSWLCTKGCEKGVVILKMERAAVLTKVDIGNAHSAFIEVLVGRASDSSDKFQTLIPTSTFMTPNESKASLNKNQVRFFTIDDFDHDAVGKQWDLLKVVCSQPFDKHVSYGICFVKVHGEVNSTQLPLRQVEEQEIAVGSFFRKRKSEGEEREKTPSITERMREADKPSALAKHIPLSSSKVSAKLTENKPTSSKKEHKKNEDEELTDNRKNRDLGLDEPSPKRLKKDELGSSKRDNESDLRKKERDRDRSKEDKITRKESDERVSKKKAEDENARRREKNKKDRREEKGTSKAKRKRKPFNRLLEDVVFVLSGYQNPERGTYRSHALAMGARYSQDWQDGRCTHLVAAYLNTPKCNQVKGKGKIVSKDWVEKCYSDKKRYPWRRFALDKNERRQPESEEEIDLETSSPTRVQPSPSTSSHSSSKVESRSKRNSSEEEVNEEEYDAPTDDEDESPDIPTLPDFFRGLNFYVDDSIADRSVLERYITAYNGNVSPKLDDSVKYFITLQRGSILQLLQKTAKNFQAVSPTWIQTVNCLQTFTPATNFLVN